MQEIENTFIPLPDGRHLAARIWLPDNAADNPVPAILEYLPYRKRDGTAPRDESYYPAFAAAGYAGVRVDISGTGESDGEFDDEYSLQEHADGVAVVQWLAEQDWCDGNIGMMGISWGGFNSLQIAALRPEPLKAVIAIGTTVDRFNDDIHYKGGCHLYSNFSWSSTMLCFASRPPDPVLVGERWKEMWLHRLDTQPFPLELWLAHQTRDSYWKHGSVCENYEAISVPSLVISGWADGYINAPPAMAANSLSVSRAINGPWIHKYPHFAYPHPRMDFISEATRWWDRWLRSDENGAESLPDYRAYISRNVRPGGYREHEPGRWVEEKHWPTERSGSTYYLGEHSLTLAPREPEVVSVCTPEDAGIACGEFFPLKPDAELATDQRSDDGGSVMFETAILDEPVEILGRPKIQLQVAVDQPQANLVVRLIDVHPDGAATRVSWGALNLSHRESHEFPSEMTPHIAEAVVIKLDECGYHFEAGHRIRLLISTAYWPMVVPPPRRVTATVTLGQDSWLLLPVRAGGDEARVAEPADQNPVPEFICHGEPESRRWVEKDLQMNRTHYRVYDDTGDYEDPGHGMRTRHTHEECWSIAPDDPLTYRARSQYVCYMSRGDWSIRTVATSSLCCDTDNYFLNASVVAFEGEEEVSRREWETAIPRNFT